MTCPRCQSEICPSTWSGMQSEAFWASAMQTCALTRIANLLESRIVVDVAPDPFGCYRISIHLGPAGPSSNGKTPGLQPGDPGSIPGGSTT